MPPDRPARLALAVVLALLVGCRQESREEPTPAPVVAPPSPVEPVPAGRSPATPGTREITCSPAFELQPRQDLHVVDAEGRQRDAFRQWLIIDDGVTRFRVDWGAPPLSNGPVDLARDTEYTFTVVTSGGGDTLRHRVLHIHRGEEVVFSLTGDPP